MGYLKQIEVENFKSWRGKQVIGPFMRFNCIIGTNGSGKSNVMDALSFAMGERTASLRVRHLRDLVHGAHIGRPVSDTARVSLHYCDDEEQETVFCRSVSGDSSVYRINGSQVTLAKYLEALEKIGIVTKARNCLVFQGAVESIALKDPKERTKMFEIICQSKEYAEKYDKMKEALLKAKEDSQFHFNKKKSATAEKKQVSLEKVEAQKYQALVDDLDQNRLQLSLAELYHNEKGMNALSDTLREKQQAAAAMTNKLVKAEQTVKTHKKEHGRLTREQQHVEKEIRTQEQIHSQCRSQYIKARVNTSHHVKKAEERRDALRKSQRLMVIKEQELAENQQEITELEGAWRNYEKQVQEKGASRGRDIELDEDQVKRYKELKEIARKQGAVFSQQAEKLHWEVKADYEKMAFDQRRKKEVEVLSAVETSCGHKQWHIITFEDDILNFFRSKKFSLECFLGAFHLICRNDSFSLFFFSNVYFFLSQYGRLSDLCCPIHKKYQLAVTKVCSQYINAIVVASEKVARDCITFMKEERAERETFLPIDFLDVRPLSERLREVPGTKMVVDVVQINASTGANQLKKVVQFVCGNTLVCETIKDARSVAFDRQERHKTVSLDGTLFEKSGQISGGSSGLRTKAQCWDQKTMMKLKERKDQLAAELRDLMRLKRKESDLKQIIAQAQGAKTRLKYSKAELENLRKKNILKCQAEISRMESESANLESQIQMQQEGVEAKDAEMRRIREQIHQIEDLVFSDFCAEIGVDSIREYEQEHLKQQTELDKKRLEFESQRTQLYAQLEYEQNQLEHYSVILTQSTTITLPPSNFKQALFSLCLSFRQLVKLQREVMSAETALEQKRLARHNLLLACKIQSLPIILVSGSLNEISELDTESESTSATIDIYEREAQLVIDYSSLEADTRAARKCSQEFEQVKSQRFHLFSQCFEHVSVVIDQIYKRICRNSSAQAILSAENPDEPYLGGINYNCVAPGKRFMSMDNLSGGEKAIAALALLFAIHSFRPAPFFILDEVDAALDNTNIGKVTSFLREESKGNMQIIVISLKEEFFSKSDALLGVYSDFDECMFSRILTLDLQPYPLVEEDREKGGER
uniref:Structural maintenance of chromosomes 1B n=1 Tax=Sparus aurata TaxID=8175 RepID=A0A671TX05_SPAAU